MAVLKRKLAKDAASLFIFLQFSQSGLPSQELSPLPKAELIVFPKEVGAPSLLSTHFIGLSRQGNVKFAGHKMV